MTAIQPQSALALLRECQDRVLEREGIPMVLALVSEVGEMPAAPDTLTEGGSLADRMDRWRLELAPSGRDADMGQVINVLQAVSYADFGRLGGRL